MSELNQDKIFLMNNLFVILLFFVSYLFAGFQADITVNNEYNGRVYYLETDEKLMRVEIDVNSDITEVIVRRFNWLVGFERVSSQLVFKKDSMCCQHDIIPNYLFTNLTSASMGTQFQLNREDGYNNVEIVSTPVYFDNSSLILAEHDSMNDICPLSCSAPADVVMVVDGSSSIDPGGSNRTNWRLMREFIRDFADRFTIGDNFIKIGITYFAGYSTCGNPKKCDPDEFCLPFPGQTDGYMDALWNSALNDTDWYQNPGIDWLSSSTAASQYSCWQQENQGNGYASVEHYITGDTDDLAAAIDRLNNVRAYGSDDIEYTAIGNGITLAKELFQRTPSRNGGNLPRIMIIMTDGKQNAGEDYETAANAARAEGIEIFVIGIGDSVDDDQLLAIAGGNSSYVLSADDFDQLESLIEPLILSTCIGEHYPADSCDDTCSDFCTACGECIECETDSDCPSCEFCQGNLCVSNATFANEWCGDQIGNPDCLYSYCNANSSSRSVSDMCVCVECETDSDCSACEFCENQKCVYNQGTADEWCTLERGCFDNYCNISSSSRNVNDMCVCIDCYVNSDCSPCEFCQENQCVFNQGDADAWCYSRTSPNDCHSVHCYPGADNRDIANMCVFTENTEIIDEKRFECESTFQGSGTFNVNTCTCDNGGMTTGGLPPNEPPQGPPGDDDDDSGDIPPWVWAPVAVCACCCLLPLLLLLLLLLSPLLVPLVPFFILPLLPAVLVGLLILAVVVIIIVLVVKKLKGGNPVSITQ